jgi:hypothetical protein
MKHLLEYINECLILEGATGVDLKKTKSNIQRVVNYFNDNIKDNKCIMPDSDTVKNEYPELSDWFCEYEDVENALFFLKSNGNLCMYEPKVTGMSDEELKKFNIKREGEKYILPGIKTKLEATSKKIGSANSYVKVWPDEWDKFIVTGEHKVSDTKLPTTVIDFKNQGAYVLKDGENWSLTNIKHDLYKSFEKLFGKDSVLTKIFATENIKRYLSELSAEEKTVVSNSMANVLSEPLALIAMLENIDDVQREVKDAISSEELGKLYEVVIPIRQNWPVADFYVHFENLPDRLVAISVKSNGAGNTSTIMGCLPVVELDSVKLTDKDSENLLTFFNDIIPQFEKEGNVELKLSNETKDKVQNLSLYTLLLLKEETCNSKAGNAKKLIAAFENLINLIKDNEELYLQLHKICELAGTNTIEKIFVCLFNANPKTIDLIKNAVGNATSCYKIKVSNAGEAKCTKQSPEGRLFRLVVKQGGQGLNLIVKNGELIDVKIGHKTSQNQWLGYTFS